MLVDVASFWFRKSEEEIEPIVVEEAELEDEPLTQNSQGSTSNATQVATSIKSEEADDGLFKRLMNSGKKGGGAFVPPTLTEADVRRIVREELDARSKTPNV